MVQGNRLAQAKARDEQELSESRYGKYLRVPGS